MTGWRLRTAPATPAATAAPKPISSALAHLAFHVAAIVALLDRAPLVVQVLAARERDLDLRVRALEVDPRRHERQPLLVRAADELLDLLAVHQQLARSLGRMVVARRGRVRGDVHAVQPDLVVVDAGVRILERRLPVAQRLDLAAHELDAALPPL